MRLPEAEKLFPSVKVQARHLAEWRRNPMAQEVLLEIQRRIYKAVAGAFDKDEPDFFIQKGGARALSDLLGWIDNADTEILGKQDQEEDERD